MKRILVISSLLLPLSLISCVSKDKYTTLKSQLDTCQREVATVRETRGDCEKQLISATTEKEQLHEKTQTYQDLAESLRDEVAKGQVTISQMKDRLTVNLIDRVLFDSGAAQIKPNGKKTLEKVASVLKDVDDKAIRVEGHTDNQNIGPTLRKIYPTNWELSTARATAVVRYLAELGVSQKRLSATGHSKFEPVASNKTADGRHQNRRIEIELIPVLKTVQGTPGSS